MGMKLNKDKVIEMREIGLTYERIGQLFGISKQRVEQIHKKKSYLPYYGPERKVVMIRDGNKCAICDLTEKLVVHHIDKMEGNSLKNMITLCTQCHHRVHSKPREKKVKKEGKKIMDIKDDELYTIADLEAMTGYCAKTIRRKEKDGELERMTAPQKQAKYWGKEVKRWLKITSEEIRSENV